MKKILRLGTRGSPLALIQAEEVRARLIAAHPDILAENTIEIVPIRTSGDWQPAHRERSFIELGGDKGLFTKEIEECLIAGQIDMAVHSVKDVPSLLPETCEIAAVIPRADPRDAFVSPHARRLEDLPQGARVGTSSLRRQAQILARRPDLKVAPLRGNVDTRIRKIGEGVTDATVLAVAGLKRLGLENRIASVMDTEIMLPGAGQGAVGVEIRRDDERTRALLTPIDDRDSHICVTAERTLLKVLDGSCHTPLGALGRLKGAEFSLEALAAKPDGSSVVRVRKNGPAKDAAAIGAALGEELKSRLPPDFFAK